MDRKLAVPLAAAFALAGCNSQPSVDAKNAKPSEVASQVADAGGAAAMFTPGKWSTTVTIEDMDIPGMTPEMKSRMAGAMSPGKSVETCLTPEQASKPDAKLFSGMDQACTYDHYTMAGGTIDAAMSCGEGKAMRKMTMHGTYTPTSSDVETTASGGGGAIPGMTMKMRISSKRIGECDKA